MQVNSFCATKTHPESVRIEQEIQKSRTQFLRGLRHIGNHHMSREGSPGMEGAREECLNMMCGERDVLCGVNRVVLVLRGGHR